MCHRTEITNAGDWTLGLTHASQELYQLNCFPSLILVVKIET